MGDLDLVYGNLSMIINDSNMDRYDVLTSHNYHIAAHCCFCRNNDYYRNLCFKIVDWKRKITNEKPISLDEGEWSDLVCPHIRTIRRIYKYLCSPFGIHYFNVLDVLNPIFHKKYYFTNIGRVLSQRRESNGFMILKVVVLLTLRNGLFLIYISCFSKRRLG